MNAWSENVENCFFEFIARRPNSRGGRTLEASASKFSGNDSHGPDATRIDSG